MKSAKSKGVRPAPPEHLDGEALLAWTRAVDSLDAAGKLSTADIDAITLYAELWGHYRDAARHVASFGTIVKHHNGVAGANPYYKVMTELAKQLRGLMNDLGLTPASRGGKGDAVKPMELPNF